MQQLAAEMNLSETAYLWPRDGGWSLRWFTPAREVDLCGHATLAATHVLDDLGLVPAGAEARFLTRSGDLTARADAGRVEMDFPAIPVTPAPPPAGLDALVGAETLLVGRGSMGLVVLLPGADPIRALRPDDGRIAALDPFALVVSAAGAPGDDADVVSRVFLPNAGIPEDPVTGAAHCALGPLWAERLGRPRLRCRQISPRGGELEVVPRGDRVLLAGAAHTVVRGRVAAPA